MSTVMLSQTVLTQVLLTQALLTHVLLAGAGAGVVALLALGLRQLVRHDAVLRYRIMVTSLVAGAAMLPLQLLIAEIPTPLHAAVFNQVPIAAGALARTHVRETRLAAISPSSPAEALPPATVSASRSSRLDGLAPALIAVYIAGAAVMLGFHVRGLLAARRLLARARPVTDARVLRIWGSLMTDASRPPALLECGGLHAPACRMLSRAAVILPAPAASLDDDTLAASLRHEIVHLSRRDGLVATLAALARAALWFQPMLWIFVRLLGIDREQSCDAIVVRATGRPHAYALALLRFCTPPSSMQRPALLIGFESAHSVRRRITMLSHALQPANRSRRAGLLAAGLASLAAASASHGLLTAAADPGPLLPAKAVTGTNSDPARNADGPRMTAEVLAPVDGRSDVQVYKRIMNLQDARERVQGPGGLVHKPDVIDAAAPFFQATAPPAKVYPPGTWVTDEEAILRVKNSHVDGDSLRAHALRLRLPGGSKLRAVFEGRTVKIEPGPNKHDRVTVTGGSVRIVDDGGATRLEVRADRDDGALIWTAAADAGDSAFDVSTADAATGLIAHVDSRTGVPEGERQPPHGSTRWKLVAPEAGVGLIEVRMQWIYDVSEVRNPVGC